MMPIWLQMTTALSAAMAAGVMGMALVPFLTKLRLCDREKPEEDKDSDTAVKEQLRPTMGGLLLCFGSFFGLVLGVTLYREFGGADRTGDTYRMQNDLLRTALMHGLILAAAGFLTDLLRVQGRLLYRISPVMQFGTVFLITLGLLAWQNGLAWAIVPAALAAAVCWRLMQTMERKTDGVSITLGIVQLLMLTVILLKEQETLPAVYTLAGAGACMGCMVWCLHPAKCRIGCTGSYLLGSIVPVICAAQGRWKVLALTMAVYILNVLPLFIKKNDRQTLLGRMERSKMAAWKQIAMMAVFSAFCSVLAVLTA